MSDSDKSLTLLPYKSFLDIYKKPINHYLETSQPFVIIGAYGMGKGLICNYIRNLPASKYTIIYVDLEFFTDLTPQKFFGSILFSLSGKKSIPKSPPEASEDEFYWQMTVILKSLGNRKLVILLRCLSKLLYFDSRILLKFNNFLSDNSQKVVLVGSSSPKIVNYPSDDLNALLGNNFIYAARLDDESALNDIAVQEKIYRTKLSKYSNKILKLSHNIHGTIQFLCLILAKYKPDEFNDQFIYQVIYNHPKLKLFFYECFNSLTPDQINIIYNYCLLRRLSRADINSISFKRLVEFSIFYKSGKSYKFIYEMFCGFILRHLDKNKEAKKLPEAYSRLSYDLNKSRFLTPKELKVMHFLIKKKGGIVSYEDIATLLWNSPENYSVYAINKLISRIRLSIIKNTSWKCRIVTKYKAGYYLVA